MLKLKFDRKTNFFIKIQKIRIIKITSCVQLYTKYKINDIK